MVITSTLTRDEIDETHVDVAVVGAGPAGCTAALSLAKRGVRVLLIDRATFPRFKVCGGSLNLRALQILERLGLVPRIEGLGAVPLASLCLAAGGKSVALELPGGLAISRERLDAELVRACIDEGVAFLPGVTAQLGESMQTCRTLNLSDAAAQYRISAKMILAADGLQGGLLKSGGKAEIHVAPGSRIGAGVISYDQTGQWKKETIYMAVGRGGYVGATVVENGKIALAAALDSRMIRASGGLNKAAESILLEAGLPVPEDMETAPWKGTPPLTRRTTKMGDERVLVLGDAASYIEPFTGEGMALALFSGHAIATLVIKAIQSYDAAIIDEWAIVHRREVTAKQYLCRGLAALLRRPLLVRGSIALLARHPGLAKPFIRYINQPAL